MSLVRPNRLLGLGILPGVSEQHVDDRIDQVHAGYHHAIFVLRVGGPLRIAQRQPTVDLGLEWLASRALHWLGRLKCRLSI
jgi:hypothetical protein